MALLGMNSHQRLLLAKSPHCPFTCTAEMNEKVLERDGAVLDASAQGGPALCHSRIQRQPGLVLQSPVWTELSPLPAHLKAQESSC